MRALMIGLLMCAGGLWLMGLSVQSFARGHTRRFFGPMNGVVTYGTRPIWFVITALAWLGCGTFISAVGGVVAVTIDPLGAFAAPAGVLSTWSVALLLGRRGARSGDEGRGAVEALAAPDREAVVARADALPEGGERRVLLAVLAEWPEAVAEPPPAYREAAPRPAGPAAGALDRAVEVEKRALALRLVPAALGFLAAATLVVLSASIHVMTAALAALAAAVAIALGALVVWIGARREHEAFAAAVRAAEMRSR